MTRRPDTPKQWLSAEHQADTPAFRRFLQREFPAVTDLCTGPDRRQFMRLMAASFAMAGLSGCDDAPDGRAEEVPYVNNPLRIQPSARVDYASLSIQDGLANGIVVTTRNARPLKVEGNPDHPWSQGGTDVSMQAGVLDLYDPLRSQTVRKLNRPSSWQAFRAEMAGKVAELRAGQGEGLQHRDGAADVAELHRAVAGDADGAAEGDLVYAFAGGWGASVCGDLGGVRTAAGDAVSVRRGQGDRVAGRRFPRWRSGSDRRGGGLGRGAAGDSQGRAAAGDACGGVDPVADGSQGGPSGCGQSGRDAGIGAGIAGRSRARGDSRISAWGRRVAAGRLAGGRDGCASAQSRDEFGGGGGGMHRRRWPKPCIG